MSDPLVLVFEATELVLEFEAPNAPELLVLLQPSDGGHSGVGGSAAYEHTQPTASSEWVINHNLGFTPSIQVFDVAGRWVLARVEHSPTSPLTQARVYVNPAIAGYARCN